MSDRVQGPFVVPTLPGGGGPNIAAIGIGTGTGSSKLDPSTVKSAILHAMELGYRHFQTTISSCLEQPIGESIAEGLERGLVSSREEIFISSKIQYNDSDFRSIMSDLKKSLENMQLEYVDLYLAEVPIDAEGEELGSIENKGIIDRRQLGLLWASMKLGKKLGLTKSIGVCNFSSEMLENLLKFARIPPSVNQVGMHRFWRDKKLREFCSANKISIIASFSIGGKEKHLNIAQFVELEVLKKFVKHKQKTASQVLFGWAHEQGAALLLESFNEEHMKEILNIFQWDQLLEDN